MRLVDLHADGNSWRIIAFNQVSKINLVLKILGLFLCVSITAALARDSRSESQSGEVEQSAVFGGKQAGSEAPGIAKKSVPRSHPTDDNLDEQKSVDDPLAHIDFESLPTFNKFVLSAIHEMPRGGRYATNQAALLGLRRSIATDEQTGRLLLHPEFATPSFCSGATYLVFLSALDTLQRKGQVILSAETVNALPMRMQPDGVGIWGRWNANGPGTARLFHELGLGRSFTKFSEARAGDFMKIWWHEGIGWAEKGHSVVYISSTKAENNSEVITFWSANIPQGYGYKTVAKSRINRALFSRLEQPERLNGITKLSAKDSYLAEMLKRTSTEREMFSMVGLSSEVMASETNNPPRAVPVPKGAAAKEFTVNTPNLVRPLATEKEQGPISSQSRSSTDLDIPQASPVSAVTKGSVVVQDSNVVKKKLPTPQGRDKADRANPVSEPTPIQKKKSLLRRIFGG